MKLIIKLCKLIGVICLFICVGCTDQAYKRVAVDPVPKLKNKQLLLVAYNRSFPQQLPKPAKRDSIVSEKIDTSKNESVRATTDALNKYILEHPCNPDTSAIAAIIKLGIKPDLIHTKTKTTIHDSIPYEDHERLDILQLKYEASEDENKELKIKVGILESQARELKHDVRKLLLKQWVGWIVPGCMIALWLLRIYLKLKSKIT